MVGARPAPARTAALGHIRQPVAETNWRQVGGKPAGDPPLTRDLKYALITAHEKILQSDGEAAECVLDNLNSS